MLRPDRLSWVDWGSTRHGRVPLLAEGDDAALMRDGIDVPKGNRLKHWTLLPAVVGSAIAVHCGL
jgi:hypothetical protein